VSLGLIYAHMCTAESKFIHFLPVSLCACAVACFVRVTACAEFEEQLDDSKLTGQTFRHPSSQSSDDTSTSLSRSPISFNNKRPDFIFLVNKQTRTHSHTHTHTHTHLLMLMCTAFLFDHTAPSHRMSSLW